MTRHLWVDASAGVAGDMLLAALLDAGADLDEVQAAVDAVLPDTVRLSADEVTRAGQRASHLNVEVLVDDHPHRSWAAIRTMITDADLVPRIRDRALAALGRLAAAEAHVHGREVDDVHFHEVGSWDSIADVVGVCAALESLGVDTLSAGPIAVGAGRTTIAHGEVGIPVPAVVELTRGWRVRAGGSGELCTPTGAALLTALAQRCEDLPDLLVERAGTGAGTRDVPDRANVVRVIIGAVDHGGTEAAVVLEANVDDLDPRLWPPTIDTLLAHGAYDAWLTPMIMKGGRPAQTLSVLCGARQANDLTEVVLTHTSTLGVRRHRVERTMLDRGWTEVAVDGTPVSIKIGHRDGLIRQVTPEFRSVLAAAELLGRPPAEILTAAGVAAARAGWVAGPTPVRERLASLIATPVPARSGTAGSGRALATGPASLS